MDDWQDARFGLRTLEEEPRASPPSRYLSLALATGATTAIFGVINTNSCFGHSRFAEPDRLVQITGHARSSATISKRYAGKATRSSRSPSTTPGDAKSSRPRQASSRLTPRGCRTASLFARAWRTSRLPAAHFAVTMSLLS